MFVYRPIRLNLDLEKCPGSAGWPPELGVVAGMADCSVSVLELSNSSDFLLSTALRSDTPLPSEL